MTYYEEREAEWILKHMRKDIHDLLADPQKDTRLWIMLKYFDVRLTRIENYLKNHDSDFEK